MAARAARAGEQTRAGTGIGAHCVRVWDLERERVCRRAGKLEQECGRAGLAGSADLEFLAGIAAHGAECAGECREWLAWALGTVDTLSDVWEALGGTWTRFPPGHGQALRRAVAQRMQERERDGRSSESA